MEHASLPTMPATQMLIFGNAPCIAAIFRPLAMLNYQSAYCVWLAISAAIYFTGLLMLVPKDRVALLLALATPMFTLETWIGGQVSVFAFLAFALSVRWLQEQRFFLAGLALGFAAYKPSLIAIPAAMFVLGRCWRMLGGVLVSVSIVIAASFGTVGVAGMKLWLDTMRVFRYLATDPESVMPRAKYVDVNSFITNLFGANRIGYVIVAVALLVLAWAWVRGQSKMLWIATIASTLILNVYVPVYDTIILIPALVMVSRTKEFQVWMLLFCLVPWLTQSAADFLRLQLLTLVIAGFAFWAINVEIANIESVVLDKLAAALDVLAHERGEDLIGLHQVFASTLSKVRVSMFMVVSTRAARRSSRLSLCSAGH